MSIGLLRGTVSLEPHNIQWEVSAKEIIESVLCEAAKWRKEQV